MRPVLALVALAVALTGCSGGPLTTPDVLALATCDVSVTTVRDPPADYLYRIDLAPGRWARRAGDDCAAWDDTPCQIYAPDEAVEVGASSWEGADSDANGSVWLAAEGAPSCEVPYDPAWLD
jgi:hypothetical protein